MPPCIGEASGRTACPFPVLVGRDPPTLTWPPGSGSCRGGRVSAESHAGQRVGCLEAAGVFECSLLPREDEIFPVMGPTMILSVHDLH